MKRQYIMKAKFQFISCLVAGVLLIVISSGKMFAQTEGKSKLDITINRDGEQIRIDTLIDASQLPQLFEQLNEQMPALENMIQNFESEGFENFMGEGFNMMFDGFLNEDFENSFGEIFKGFEELNLERLDLNDAFRNLEDVMKDFNFEDFDGGNNFNFDIDAFRPKTKAQLGVTLSEKAIDGVTDITVNEIVKGSVAEKAGLLKGDKILEVDGKSAQHINDITRAVQTKKDKEILKLKIERNGIQTILDVEMDVPKPVSEKIKKV